MGGGGLQYIAIIKSTSASVSEDGLYIVFKYLVNIVWGLGAAAVSSGKVSI